MGIVLVAIVVIMYYSNEPDGPFCRAEYKNGPGTSVTNNTQDL